MNAPTLPKNQYPLVLAEHEPAFIRYIPFLSKRRRESIKRLEETVGGNYKRKNTPFFQTVNLKRAVEGVSSVTLEMALEQFGGKDQPHMVVFFKSVNNLCPKLRNETQETLARAILSYKDVLEEAIPNGSAKYVLTSPHDSRISITETFTIAKLSHPEFYSYEDMSAMRGEVRARFEAVLTVLARNMYDSTGLTPPNMSNSMVALIRRYPERAHDILRYQESRNLKLNGMSTKALSDYLEAPAAALGDGML